MNYLYLMLGILLYIAASCDLAYTTFSSSGAGYLTNTLTKGLWRISLYMCGRDGSKRLLEYVGIFTIGTIIITWFVLIWIGSACIILSDPGSVVHAATNSPARTIEKIYYAGYTLTTLGNGDLKPAGNTWRLFTVMLSFSGFMFITTAVSYMLPVLAADVEKKKISKKVFILGSNPQELLLNHYHNGNFHKLEPYFSDFTDIIITHSQQLLAYPILYSFHSSRVDKSAAISIAVLDEVLTILLVHIPEENRPSNHTIAPLRKVIVSFLNILNSNFIKTIEADTSFPDLQPLKEAGVQLINCTEDKQKLYERFARRRSLIGVMLSNEGWHFDDIYRHKTDPEQNG